MASHKFSSGTIEVINDFTMKIRFEKDHDVTIEDLKEITGVRENIIGEIEYCSLVDVRHDFLSFTDEAKRYIANNPKINKYRIAEALLVKNFGQKLGVELYIRLFKPKRVTKVFENEAKAVKWLEKKYTDKLESI